MPSSGRPLVESDLSAPEALIDAARDGADILGIRYARAEEPTISLSKKKTLFLAASPSRSQHRGHESRIVPSDTPPTKSLGFVDFPVLRA